MIDDYEKIKSEAKQKRAEEKSQRAEEKSQRAEVWAQRHILYEGQLERDKFERDKFKKKLGYGFLVFTVIAIIIFLIS